MEAQGVNPPHIFRSYFGVHLTISTVMVIGSQQDSMISGSIPGTTWGSLTKEVPSLRIGTVRRSIRMWQAVVP